MVSCGQTCEYPLGAYPEKLEHPEKTNIASTGVELLELQQC
jgi:hypothetical protein